jgi:hypothetical protein
MSLTPAEAQSALKDIEKTENRTAASQHGRNTAPYLVMWGVIWAIGYAVSAAAVQYSWVWLALIIAGIAGSVILSMRQAHGSGRGKGFAWRYFASFSAIAVFVVVLLTIMQPLNYNQTSATFPLIIGMFYAFIGIWTKGWRMLPLGLALIGLTVAGYFFLPAYFLYWMAAEGGGGLILGGLWLRSA